MGSASWRVFGLNCGFGFGEELPGYCVPGSSIERVEIWWEESLERWWINLEYAFAQEPLEMILMILGILVVVYLLMSSGLRVVNRVAERFKNHPR